MSEWHRIEQSDADSGLTCPDVGVLAFVPDRWSEKWMSRHHLLARLARRFPVVWVEPPHEWREIPDCLLRDVGRATPETPPGLLRHRTPWWLPKLYRPAVIAEWLKQRRVNTALKRIDRLGIDDLILYLWRPGFAEALDLVPHDLSVYHIVDEYTFSEVEVPIPEEERLLIGRSDTVLIHSPGLMERKGRINPNTFYVPNGVDFDLYARDRPEPEDLRSIPRPRVGYTGWLKKQLDWPLLVQIASRRPDWQLVLVGPVKDHPEIRPHVEALRGRENVHILGGKTVTELAAYPGHFDVSVMPYRKTAYTDCIYPLKLHEYLAAGTPVVGTGIRTLEEFSDVVRLANGADEWSAQLAAALDEGDDGAIEQRRSVARQHDWDRLADLVAGHFLRGLGREEEAGAIAPEDPPVLGNPRGSGGAA